MKQHNSTEFFCYSFNNIDNKNDPPQTHGRPNCFFLMFTVLNRKSDFFYKKSLTLVRFRLPSDSTSCSNGVRGLKKGRFPIEIQENMKNQVLGSVGSGGSSLS